MTSSSPGFDAGGSDWAVGLVGAFAAAYLVWLQFRRWKRSDAYGSGLALVLAIMALGALVFELGRLFDRPSWSSRVDTVFHQTFAHEEVGLDGRAFSNCTFEDVTFVYDGTGDFSFANSRFVGRSRVVSRNRAVNAAWVFLRQVEADFGDRSPIVFPGSASQRTD